jgi:hypothetical protein
MAMTPPVLAPGAGKTKTGRFWTYVRDERPHRGERPPAAMFFIPGPQWRAAGSQKSIIPPMLA